MLPSLWSLFPSGALSCRGFYMETSHLSLGHWHTRMHLLKGNNNQVRALIDCTSWWIFAWFYSSLLCPLSNSLAIWLPSVHTSFCVRTKAAFRALVSDPQGLLKFLEWWIWYSLVCLMHFSLGQLKVMITALLFKAKCNHPFLLDSVFKPGGIIFIYPGITYCSLKSQSYLKKTTITTKINFCDCVMSSTTTKFLCRYKSIQLCNISLSCSFPFFVAFFPSNFLQRLEHNTLESWNR